MDIAQRITKIGLFDPDWYVQTYPDAAAAAQEPVRHYLSVGVQRGYAPSAGADVIFHMDIYGLNRTSSAGEILAHMAAHFGGRYAGAQIARLPWALDRLARRGRAALAARIAQTALPADLGQIAHILAANMAAAQMDMAAWLGALNAYLDHFGMAAVSGSLSQFGPTTPEGWITSLTAAPRAQVQGGPLVSVIMPVWQSRATVAAAVASVLAQGWQNLEIIAVDDASNDGSGQILSDMAARDDRLKILRNCVNVGPYVARNRALGLARGDWICCHDADEWAHPDRIAMHMDWVLATGAPPVSQIGMLRMTQAGQISQIDRVGGHTFDGALRPCPSAALFHAPFLRQTLGAWESMRFGADHEMVARAKLALGHDAPMLARPLVLSLDHPASLTRRKDTGLAGGAVSPLRRAYLTYRTDKIAALASLQGAQQQRALFEEFPPRTPSTLPPEIAVPLADIAQCLR
jgi:hypothetical protein